MQHALILPQLTGSPQGDAALNLIAYSVPEVILNAALATVLGMLVAAVYRSTHKGLSYSQSFTQTIVFIALIVALVMMVIGSNVARAFALVGALSIIRFRTVVKDTKDTAFVFASLALGMAAGTSNYVIAAIGLVFVSGLTWLMDVTNFGALHRHEFVLRFAFDQEQDSGAYLAKINQYARRSSLLNIEPSGDGKILKLTYDIQLNKAAEVQAFTSALDQVPGVHEVMLVVGKNDVDY